MESGLIFEERLIWALNFLGKEDRVIWYLGILQRAAILQKHKKGQCNSSALRKKLFRILKNYSAERICQDYLLNSEKTGNILEMFRRCISTQKC